MHDMSCWYPNTLEDRLLARYHADHPGALFLELEVGGEDPVHGPRRIDGVFVPGERSVVHPRHAYSRQEALDAIRGRPVHLLEAKRTLNRNVFGQVVAGADLLRLDFEPAEIRPVAVCADGNRDMRGVCERHGIHVAIYEVRRLDGSSAGEATGDGRTDVRFAPDDARRRAFLAGWSEAVDGRLYATVRSRKTHANMGNLFGWIYGDQPEEFRLETWERYVSAIEADLEDEE